MLIKIRQSALRKNIYHGLFQVEKDLTKFLKRACITLWRDEESRRGGTRQTVKEKLHSC